MPRDTTFKPPKTLAECADLLSKIKQERFIQQKIVDELQKKEIILKKHLIDNLPKSQASGISGKIANAKITQKEIPQMQDWDAFWKDFDKEKDTDLLQRRLSNEAVKLRWEAGKQISGVGKYIVIDVSITKI
jgi:uncharacterized membrane protein YraQ (UPF0718 family)